MLIEIKGLEFDEVHDYLDSRDAGEGDLDIYIDDYGYVDAEEGDYRRLVEITMNLDFDEEESFIEVIEDLAKEEPDAEINYL
jgi:hypothetical protein